MCEPLNVEAGPFIDAGPWSYATPFSRGGKSVVITEHGIRVDGPTGERFFSLTGNISYMFFGSNDYLLVLTSSRPVGPVTHRVSLVDFTADPPRMELILDVLAAGSDVPEPRVQYSLGTGSAFLIYASDGDEIHNLAIYRSDNGEILCAGPGPFSSEGDIRGEASETHVIINYDGPGSPASEELPAGELTVDPDTRDFGEAVIGGPPELARATAEFELTNDGNDCLLVQAIADADPFSVVSTTPELPADLEPGASVEVTVAYEPSEVGHHEEALPVARTPANGDDSLNCVGEAQAAIRAIVLSPAPVEFHTQPVGEPDTRELRIDNDGHLPLTVSIDASTSADFRWPPFAEVIPYGEHRTPTITFEPTREGMLSATVTVESDAPTSPDTVTVRGTGCVANAEIEPEPERPLDYGQVQRGFRTVRFIRVVNIGGGPLTFNAEISGADTHLFGLQLSPPDGSITDLHESLAYTVPPLVACGDLETGSGETVVAVGFYAGDAPRTVDAQLVLSGHNATNTARTSWTYPLIGEIVQPVALDACLVLDRSGSMGEAMGEREKYRAVVTAGQLFTQLLRADVDDRVALVKFNPEPELIEGMTTVTSANQESLVLAINETALQPLESTAIAGGMLLGLAQFEEPRTPPVPDEINKVMVVLTDGKDNTAYFDPDTRRWYSLLGGSMRAPLPVIPFPFTYNVETIPVPIPSDVKVYGVALGTEENVDTERLDAVSTGSGAYSGAIGEDLEGRNYFQLEKHFTQVFMDAAGMAPIVDPVYTIHPGQEHRIAFDVLRGDVSMIAVVYDRDGLRLPFYLESEHGEKIDAALVPVGYQLRCGATGSARFIEVQLPQDEPERYACRWAVVVRHDYEVCAGPPVSSQGGGDGGGVFGPGQRWGFLPPKCRSYKEPVDYGVAIGAGSNFRLQAMLTPGVVSIGEPILLTGLVSEAGLPVRGCIVTVTAESPSGATQTLTLYDDGEHEDGEHDDGEYAQWFTRTAEAGMYRFSFRAVGRSRDGEPVVREAVRSKAVEGSQSIYPPPVASSTQCCWWVVILLVIIVLLMLVSFLFD